MTMTASARRQAHIEQIETLFSDPPSLLAVAQDSAQAYLDQHFAARNERAGALHLVTPEASPCAGAWRYVSLAQLLVERLASARPMLLVEACHQVVRRVREVFEPGGLSLAELEVLINECGALLLEAFAQRLQAWWHEAMPVDMVRWGYLSDELLALLYDAQTPPGMSQARVAQLFPKALLRPNRPDRQWSLDSPTLRVQTVHLSQQNQVRTLPWLVLDRTLPQGGSCLLLYSPASGITPIERMDDIGVLLVGQVDPLPTGQVAHWFVRPVEGDPFDALAASFLERQLRDIDRINRLVPRTPLALQQLLDAIIDPLGWFVAQLSPYQQRLRAGLPLWLSQADATDSAAFAQLLRGWALTGHDDGAQDYLDGIPSIEQFADEQLRACLKQHPGTVELKPHEISIRFDRVIAAAVPVPGGFIAGEVEPVTVTLVQLALENLAGFPHTPKAITLKGENAPAWLNYRLLGTCIEQVDIGQFYPQLLRRKLVDDATEAARRQRLFSRQLRNQLPLLALEYKARGLQGLTRSGFLCLQAALQATPTERLLDGKAMALWPLAFQAAPDQAADVVANQFIIGPQAGHDGPHLLYRPLLSPMLQEYENLAALFEAIKAPGELQEQALIWMEPRRQAVYANGGFSEPHIRHFLPSDEFAVYTKPGPAQLHKHVAPGDPTQQVFMATADALVALADRQSQSNAEQRWASLKTIGWLLFTNLLPFLRGPMALAGWMLQLADSVQHDLESVRSTDPQARAAAVTDMLVNLVAVLAHQAAPHDLQRHLDLEHPAFAPLARAEPVAVAPVRVDAPVAFSAPLGWANARDTLTPAMQARLTALSLMLPPAAESLDLVESSGPMQGLVKVSSATPPQWRARVRGHVYRVQIQQGRVRVVSATGEVQGPWLKHLGEGRWDVDLGLHLRGGAADSMLQEARQAASTLKDALTEDYQQARLAQARARRAMAVARVVIEQPVGAIAEQRRIEASRHYQQEAEKALSHAQRELQCLRALRDLAPRPHYEQELCEALESVILSTQLLGSLSREHMVVTNAQLDPVLKVLEDETEDEAQSDINRQAHSTLGQGLRELARIQENAIRWRTLEDRYLDELRQVPKQGRTKAEALTAALPARPSVQDLQALQFTTLWGIAIDVAGPPLEDGFFDSVSETINRARRANRSMADLRHLQVTDQERIDLLQSIDRVYAQTDDQIEFWRAMEPDKFNVEYLQQLQALLTDLHLHIERQLNELQQGEVPAAPKTKPAPPVPGARRKKIIRTRNRDLYVAQLSEAPGLPGGETAELQDPSGAVIAAFTEAEDGVWDAQPSPPRRRPNRELSSLMEKGEDLLANDEKAIRNVEKMIESVNEPASLQHLLESQAISRRWVAEDIRKKLSMLDTARLAVVQQAKAEAMVSRLRAAVASLEAAGLDARIRASKLRPITPDTLEFLYSHREVQITRRGERVKLKKHKNDYLQVYKVADVATGRALCFAHFHYKTQTRQNEAYEAAHLKQPGQEYLGREDQAEVEAAMFARIRRGQTGKFEPIPEIERGKLSLGMARRLFFSLD
ncbi:hypothetical protein [Pseudomonas extremorientalis]|uniref:Uncharacterized protein n=1 Tax=Pseudomonas extremorientalis TaxID=169669 RepID=A0A1H0V9G3_9PSED|nr:hypothetical protein [Pseudomonas extremorientalis]KAB0517155.1 hypothetical protein F7R08_20385 [Pseudomonas extremorientalis]OIN11373.1 hypothetical protein BFN10_04585 [Pseudomonas extremorientalis]SDP75047.1 hypothetical protein SAMN04490184_4682 [Pseudomonas extremorientalis]